jgi:nucleoside-diphosphate-sugar epimerase
VNYVGTLNVIEACRKHGVGKIVMSSSPSTRYGSSILCYVYLPVHICTHCAYACL